MVTHTSFLAWRIPGTGEPGGLPSMGSHRVGHDWSDLAAVAAQVYKGNDLCWNWRCDFSWVTGVQAWQSAMSPRARWYGPGEWLPSPRSGILKFSNWRSCGLPFVVPAGAELTNRESLLAWAVQPNLPTAPTTGQRWWRPEPDDGLLCSSHRMQLPLLVNSLSLAHRYFKFPGIMPPSCYTLVNRRHSSGRH